MNAEPFRLGTRGSQLARRQAEIVQEALERHRFDVEIVEVSTTGDRLDDAMIHQLGKTGAFVRDIDERVLAGELDAAVHSLKDMPTDMPEDLIVAAIPERVHPHDALVTPEGSGLRELPDAATIGTASLRRRAQLQASRDDLAIEPVRGNVDTRLEKLLGPHLRATYEQIEEDEQDEWMASLNDLESAAFERETENVYDGLVLASAGLHRSGLMADVQTAALPIEDFVPAPGQGAIAVTMRDTDQAETVHTRLDHPASRVAVTVERVILAELGGGCIAPIGIHAIVQGEVVKTRVQVLSSDGEEIITATRDLPVQRHASAAAELAEDLAEDGADRLIAEAAKDDPGGSVLP